MKKTATWTAQHSRNLVDLVRGRALSQPDKRAFTFLVDGESEEVWLDFGELDRRARAIGGWLQDIGAAGERALLLFPPGLDFITSFFGCLYAGVTAVPLFPPRPKRPAPRFQAVTVDARASLALTTGAILADLESRRSWSEGLPNLRWEATDSIPCEAAPCWREPDLAKDDLAFLQYTSGSTAAPKGVMVTHGGLLHNQVMLEQAFRHPGESAIVSWLPFYHDMGLIGNVIHPVYLGASCVLMSPVAFLQRPLRWLQAITRYRAGTSGGPNFAYDLCVRAITPDQHADLDLSSWGLAFNGAEPVRPETMTRFAEAFGPCGFRREAFYPCYGLAEATLFVTGGDRGAGPVIREFQTGALEQRTAVAVTDGAGRGRALVGCGRTWAEQHAIVVEPESRLACPPGHIGEIWLAGPSVARGYWDRPLETEQTFRAFLSDSGEGPYLRTGDLGFLAGEELFVTGRLKDLIIIRGRNLYPQDIEASVANCHPALRHGGGAAFSVDTSEEQLVVVHEVDRHFARQDLEAVYSAIRRAVAEEHEAQVHGIALLRQGSIPKTSSGKIQRHACREAYLAGELALVGEWREDVAREEEIGYAAWGRDGESVETWLTALLEAKLGIEPGKVDVTQSITSYGLDSLQAIQLAHLIEVQTGVTIPLATLFAQCSLADLAREIARLAGERPASRIAVAPAGENEGYYQLSRGQQALWFLYQLDPQNAAYNVSSAVRIVAELDADALRRAFQVLVDRHVALRTTFTSRGGEPVQLIRERVEVEFQVEDASAWSEQDLDRRLIERAYQPFDLENDRLLRVDLYRRSPREHVLLLTMHHIVTDFWSLAILVYELGLLYEAERDGRKALLPSLGLQYTDYVRWQTEMLAGPDGERHWQYWQEQLSGELPVLNLPTDMPRPPAQTYRGCSYSWRLDAEITRRLKAISREHGATLQMTLLAAFQLLLHGYTGQKDILVGTLTAGRSRADLAHLMGYFVNPVVLRADLTGNPDFPTYLERVRRIVLDALAHQDYPFAALVEHLQPVRDPSRSPLFQVVFVLQQAQLLKEEGLTAFALGAPGASLTVGGMRLEVLELAQRIAQFDLTLTVGEVEGGLAASFEYNADLFLDCTIARMARHLQNILQGIVTAPTRPIMAATFLSEEEQGRLLLEWNGQPEVIPRELCVSGLFSAQVARTPDQVALIHGDRRLTYHELDLAAERLARHLRSLGVGPEAMVGICLERSPEMMVAILGVLKAGGAYVPLDPSYPKERLAYIMTEARVPVLLTREGRRAGLPEGNYHVVCLDSPGEEAAGGTEPRRSAVGGNLACLVYTSGSTGQPKGVLLENKSLVNLIASFNRSYQTGIEDRVMPLTAISSASFVGEILPILCAGGALVLPADEEVCDLDALVSLVIEHTVTIISSVPSLIASLNALPGHLPRLRLILSGGEALSLGDVDALLDRAAIVNGYGLTEATICSTYHYVQTEELAQGATIPIGKPIVNNLVYILDDNLRCVPVGCPGELYIGGTCLARGYLARPALTAERFLPNPYVPGERIYRTGDLARWRRDGVVEFLGRLDQQVKIRGFRVELGEIEARLKQHPAVQEAAVTVREDLLGRRLAAYVAPRRDYAPTLSDLRHWVRESLPEYMVPSSFTLLDELPIAASGKVDRAALPEPDMARPDPAITHMAPRSEAERAIAGVWREVLQLQEVGTEDNFFDLGGHSLLMVRAHRRLQEALQGDLSLVDLFKYPTIRALAEHLAGQEPGSTPEVQDRARRQREALSRRRQVMKERADVLKAAVPAGEPLPSAAEEEDAAGKVREFFGRTRLGPDQSRSGPPADEVKTQMKRVYNAISDHLAAHEFGREAIFLNFGYAATAAGQASGIVLPANYPNRNSIKLILELIGDFDLTGRAVLDVGCGRGGSIYVMKKYFRPGSVTGIDLSPAAVSFCRERFGDLGVDFLEGDAEHLPFADESFDVVINVESSSCYPNVRAFMAQVHRVLRKNGSFLYTDFFSVDALPGELAALQEMGFVLERNVDITENVVLSCDETLGRLSQVYRENPAGIKEFFAAGPGSTPYDEMVRGEITYRIFRLRKSAVM